MGPGDTATVFKGSDGQFYWHIRAANHETIAHSEGYKNHADAVSVLEEHFPGVTVVDETGIPPMREFADGQSYEGEGKEP